MSVPPDQFDRERYARSGSSDAGNPVFEWNFTRNTLNDLVKLVAQDMRLPIVFVPGIMGTNLMDLDENPVWRLDTGSGFWGFVASPVVWYATRDQPVGLMKSMIFKEAGKRQRLMHPERTQVDPRGSVPDKAAGTIIGGRKKEREAVYRDRRFWGEVAEASYHGFLLWLEDRLNGHGINPAMWREFTYARPMMSAAPTPGQPRPEPKLLEGQEMMIRDLHSGAGERPWVPLKSDDLIKRAKFRMPVYACGYNWLASNNNAARQLQSRIEHVIAQERCEQVLLITHSMGGLVARRCAQLGGMQDKIAGIVHGVMPAAGAAVAYRRCKVGMRDESVIAAQVMGRTGQEVTAVFAQAPGALQLLPNQDYRPGWLKIKGPSGDTVEVQPTGDPYEDIYLRRDRWWGLVREEWLRPDGGSPISWSVFRENIHESRDFQDVIRGAYHPQTYVHYGADAGIASYETVTWQMKQGLRPDSKPVPTPEQVGEMGFDDVRDSGNSPLRVGGELKVMSTPSMAGAGVASTYQTSYWDLEAEKADGGGDGTVPISSGRAPMLTADNQAHIQQQFRLSGFEHEPSYKDGAAQLSTLYSIQKIAAEAKVSS